MVIDRPAVMTLIPAGLPRRSIGVQKSRPSITTVLSPWMASAPSPTSVMMPKGAERRVTSLPSI